MPQLLIIDDDAAFCAMLQTFLLKKGFKVSIGFSAAQGLKQIGDTFFEVVITDLRLPDHDGIHVLNEVKRLSPKTQVIVMTGYAQVKTAVKAIQKGAFDYIEKPVQPDEILTKIQAAAGCDENMTQPALKTGDNSKSVVASVLVPGISQASKRLNEFVKLVGPTDMSVLIIGDSGTGKENIARSIHDQSERKGGPFIPVDCGAIPKDLASSEFFGHVKGSFTGAINDKIGHFKAASNGTLFLDEIGNLSYHTQIQLLRALQEFKIKPVGSNEEVEVNVRVIAATNENLKESCKRGDFREDLYHRLNEFSIEVPKLSERAEDLMVFANYFLDVANNELNKQVVGFSDEVVDFFKKYHWPGNLRELKNVIKRATLLTRESMILPKSLPREILTILKENNGFDLFSQENEEALILKALKKTGGNKSKAANLMNIDRKTLYNKIKLYGIET